MESQHTKVSFTLQAILVMSVMTMVVSGILLYVLISVHAKPKPPAQHRPNGNTGNIGELSAEVIEAEYGPVNKTAANELKDGLFGRIRAARQGCYSSCVTRQRQVWCSRASSYYGTPTYYYATTVASPVVVRTVPTVVSPVVINQQPFLERPNPLKIQPSCEDGQCNVQLSIQSSAPDKASLTIQIKPSI